MALKVGPQEVVANTGYWVGNPYGLKGADGSKGAPGGIGGKGGPGEAGADGGKGGPGENATKGAKGEKGQPGADSTVDGDKGLPGEDSTVDGDKGLPGEDGADSTVDGEKGQPGEDGADSTVDGDKGEPGDKGQPGEDSTVDGDKGEPGEDSTVDGDKGEPGEGGVAGGPGQYGSSVIASEQSESTPLDGTDLEDADATRSNCVHIGALTIQAGSNTENKDGSYNITFPVAFTKVYSVVCTRIGSGMQSPMNACNVYTTYFTINRDDGIGGRQCVNWVAIGKI
jgi:hypothetical protein